LTEDNPRAVVADLPLAAAHQQTESRA
jgi:hypothetical protein